MTALRFDPMVDEDEDAAHTAREQLVERFGCWLPSHPEHEAADPWDVDLLLSWKWGYADGDYARWTRADVDEVLLEHLPRKLSASPTEAASIPASIAAFAAFLETEGLLDPDSDPAEVVAHRARAQQRAFLDAMADPANYGMAKRLFTLGGLDLPDEPDQAALDDAMAAFNALPFEERGRILGLDRAPMPAPTLPPLPLRPPPSADDLEAAASHCTLLQRVDALHDALAREPAKLTRAGNPTTADGKRLVSVLGLEDPVDGIRSSAELAALFALGQVALRAGAIEVDGNRLRAAERWADESSVSRWQRIVDGVLGAGPATLRFGSAEPMPIELAELADEGAIHFLSMLWLADEPVHRDVFVDMLDAASVMDPRAKWIRLYLPEDRAEVCRGRIADVFVTLADAGMVRLEQEQVALTPAGARLIAPHLAAAGFDVLLPETVAGLAADDLLDVVERRGDAPEVAATAWTGVASGRDRAGELVSALVARPEPTRVVHGFTILEQIGAEALDAVRRSLDTAIAPHAWLFLAARGVVEHHEIPPEMVTRAGVDLFLALAQAGSPADVVESLLGHLPTGGHPQLIDDLAGGDHPRTGELLEQLGRHHPAKAVAKHARKAAHRWRSRQGARTVASRSR